MKLKTVFSLKRGGTCNTPLSHFSLSPAMRVAAADNCIMRLQLCHNCYNMPLLPSCASHDFEDTGLLKWCDVGNDGYQTVYWLRHHCQTIVQYPSLIPAWKKTLPGCEASSPHAMACLKRKRNNSVSNDCENKQSCCWDSSDRSILSGCHLGSFSTASHWGMLAWSRSVLWCLSGINEQHHRGRPNPQV